MNTGTLNPTARTFDLGLYDETDSALAVTSTQIQWSYRDEESKIVSYSKTVPDLKVGQLGDYVVSSSCKEVPEPFALNGYYPLYLTSAQANLNSDGAGYHEHVISIITWIYPPPQFDF